MTYQKEAATILKAVGGEENIEEMAHCATRLRLTLKDEGRRSRKSNLASIK